MEEAGVKPTPPPLVVFLPLRTKAWHSCHVFQRIPFELINRRGKARVSPQFSLPGLFASVYESVSLRCCLVGIRFCAGREKKSVDGARLIPASLLRMKLRRPALAIYGNLNLNLVSKIFAGGNSFPITLRIFSKENSFENRERERERIEKIGTQSVRTKVVVWTMVKKMDSIHVDLIKLG